MDVSRSQLLACLKEAAQTDNLELLRNLKDINIVCDSDGSTLLHIAAGFGSHKVLDYLIKRNINVNAPDKHGAGALSNGCSYGRLETVKKLIKAGADVNMTDSRKYTPLHCALKNDHRRTIKLLLQNGANPKLASIRGNNCFDKAKTPELRAFIWNHYMAYKLRRHVEFGSFNDVERDLNEIDKSRELVDRVKICFTKNDLDNSSLLETAIRCLPPNELVKLIQGLRLPKEAFIAAYFEIILHCDSREQLETVKLLLELEPTLLNARLVAPDIPSITALHRAAGFGYKDLTFLLLVDMGADPNASDANGSIPLHYAAHWGHHDIVKLLIDTGSDVNKADINGLTPLHESCKQSKIQICNLLVSTGACLTSKDKFGNTPYQLATELEIKELLEKSQINLPILDDDDVDEIYLPVNNIPSSVKPPTEYTYHRTYDSLMIDIESVTNLIKNPQKRDQVKLITIKETDEKYKTIKDRMDSTIVDHENGPIFTHYEITSIKEILNEKIFQKYKQQRENIKGENNGDANERLLFHGSFDVNKLVLRGFDERYASWTGMFGPGLYFAQDSSKSNQYTFGLNGPCKEHKDKNCYLCERKLLYCQVALGNSKKVTEVSSFFHAPIGHHSVSALPDIIGRDLLNYPEYIIYRGEQAYPLYLIKYRIANRLRL